MTYRTVMVHMCSEPRAGGLLDVAIEIARRHKAHVVGVVALPPPVIASFGLPDAPAPVLMEDYRRSYIAECERMRALFVARTAEAGIAAEWQIEDAWATSVGQKVLEAAGAVDLIVASQADRRSASGGRFDSVERFIVESGRPVVVVPASAASGSVIGQHILVGWNGSREAVRAVFDALPLLRQAGKATLVSIADPDSATFPPDPLLDRLRAALQRHGVATTVVRSTCRSRDTGRELLRHAVEQSADLLVMGCYGHSRMREFVLGGVTRYVLEHANIPVLMAH